MSLLGFPVFCSSSSTVLSRYFNILFNSMTIFLLKLPKIAWPSPFKSSGVVTGELDASASQIQGLISSPSYFGCRSKSCCITEWFLKSLKLNLSSFVSLPYREHYPNCQHYTITTVCILHITFSPWAISSDPNFQSHLIRVLLLLWTWFQPSDRWVKSVSWNNWSVSVI